MENSIIELSKKYDTDKRMDNGIRCRNGVLGHNYAQHYDNILPHYNIELMLEIGVSWGASIKMWYEYFPMAMIYGMDINENRFKKKDLENDRIKIVIGDQGNMYDLLKLNHAWDFIVDDGSHKTDHQLLSFEVLFHYLRSGGLYVVEDIHVSKFKELFYPSSDVKSVRYFENNSIVFIEKK